MSSRPKKGAARQAPRFTDHFLGLSAKASAYERARYAILPVPYDATTTFQTGARFGPRAILTASRQLEEFDVECGREFSGCGIATLDSLEVNSAGPREMHEDIHQAARPVVRDGKFLIGLGGDHSVTSGLVRAVLDKHRDLSVLQFDAHADLRDRYQGSPYSHACVMRRVREMGVPVVAVGIRQYSAEEKKFMRGDPGVRLSVRQIRDDTRWMERVVAALRGSVYVSVDIDAFDPAYAPGTGTPEPGGMDWFQVTDLLAAVARAHRIVAADVTEVMPVPGSMVTEFLAARLVYKLIACVESARR
jgi:agmatinase